MTNGGSPTHEGGDTHAARFGRRALLLAAPAALVVASCDHPNVHRLTFYYELIIEVDTRDGLKTGKSLVQVRWYDGTDIPPAGGQTWDISRSREGRSSDWSADWVWIDFGEGRVVAIVHGMLTTTLGGTGRLDQLAPFALGFSDPKRQPQPVNYHPTQPPFRLFNERRLAAERSGEVIELPIDAVPLVYFSDATRPESARLIRAREIANLFPGARLRRIGVRFVPPPRSPWYGWAVGYDPLSNGVASLFPWARKQEAQVALVLTIRASALNDNPYSGGPAPPTRRL